MPFRAIRQFFVRQPEYWINGLALWAVAVALLLPPESWLGWRLGALAIAFVLVRLANKAVARDRAASEERIEKMFAHMAQLHRTGAETLDQVAPGHPGVVRAMHSGIIAEMPIIQYEVIDPKKPKPNG